MISLPLPVRFYTLKRIDQPNSHMDEEDLKYVGAKYGLTPGPTDTTSYLDAYSLGL